MYTLYDFMKKFPYDSFTIFSHTSKNRLLKKSINFEEMKQAIKYCETPDEKTISALSEKAVNKVLFEYNYIHIED